MNRSEKILNQRISVLESQLFNYYKMIKMYHTGDFSDKCDFNPNEMFVVDKVGNKNNIRLVDCSKLSIKTIHNVVKGLSKPTEKRIGIYTDGACEPNPGPGSCGFVVVENDKVVHEDVIRDDETTNNRMEMWAIIMALSWVNNQENEEKYIIFSDSKYCVNGINDWIKKWKKKNYKDVKNPDLWKVMDDVFDRERVVIDWVKGHNGNKWNEYIDNLIK